MNVYKNLFFLILTFFYTYCQDYICNSNDASDLKVGDKVYLCIHNIQNETRIAFPIEVDEYSVATIKGLYNNIKDNNDINIEFLAQVGTLTSVFKAVRKEIIKYIIVLFKWQVTL